MLFEAAKKAAEQEKVMAVLILVLEEYALREGDDVTVILTTSGLNPCSRGICSSREWLDYLKTVELS